MLAHSSVRQPPTSGASATPSPTVSTYGILRILEHAARAARAAKARWNHSSVSLVRSSLLRG